MRRVRQTDLAVLYDPTANTIITILWRGRTNGGGRQREP